MNGEDVDEMIGQARKCITQSNVQILTYALLGREDPIPPGDDRFRRIRAYKFQMDVNLGTNGFNYLRKAFPELELPSLKALRRDMRELAGLDFEYHDCCEDSCMAFVGPYANVTACSECGKARYRHGSVPFKRFGSLSLISQVKALYGGVESAKAMRYRADNHDLNLDDGEGRIADIYDSELYRDARKKQVVVNGKVLPHKYFEFPRDVTLIGITDGFQLFKRGKHTAWPLIYINANLAPGDRYSVNTVICFGIIPGPKKPKNFDSFLYVAARELGNAAAGV